MREESVLLNLTKRVVFENFSVKDESHKVGRGAVFKNYSVEYLNLLFVVSFAA